MNLLTRKEAAGLLRICERHLDRQLRLGRIRCVRIGRRILIPEDAIQQFLRVAGGAA